MRRLGAIIGICLIGCMAQAQSTTGSTESTGKQSQAAKSNKEHDPQARLAEINEHLAKRQAEEKEATSKGRTDIANALNKVIADLNSMKTALTNNDMAAFKTAEEQRNKDREALEALRKADKGSKPEKSSKGSSSPLGGSSSLKS